MLITGIGTGLKVCDLEQGQGWGCVTCRCYISSATALETWDDPIPAFALWLPTVPVLVLCNSGAPSSPGGPSALSSLSGAPEAAEEWAEVMAGCGGLSLASLPRLRGEGTGGSRGLGHRPL